MHCSERGNRMERRLLIGVAVTCGVLLSSCAGPGVTKGNDTGGIIAWSPEARVYARDIAANHCAAYGKVARITGVVPSYGNYISFSCRFDRRFRGYGY